MTGVWTIWKPYDSSSSVSWDFTAAESFSFSKKTSSRFNCGSIGNEEWKMRQSYNFGTNHVENVCFDLVMRILHFSMVVIRIAYLQFRADVPTILTTLYFLRSCSSLQNSLFRNLYYSSVSVSKDMIQIHGFLGLLFSLDNYFRGSKLKNEAW